MIGGSGILRDSKGATQGLGMEALLRDWNAHAGVDVLADSSAAKAIASRRGLGKVRHIEVCQLWVQERVHRGGIRVTQVQGESTPADIMTKHVGNATLIKHLTATGVGIETGRHALNPRLAE